MSKKSTVWLFAVLLTWPALAANDAAYQAVLAGNAHYQAENYHAALEEYAKAAQLEPNSAAIEFNQGGAHVKLFDYEKALTHYTNAIQAADPELSSRIKYNLGVVMHEIAISSMLTFRDAVTPLRTAMSHYRDSLEQNPDQPDARYNLELAHRLNIELRLQKVQMQANPEARDQKTSDNQGQDFEEQTDQQSSDQRDLPNGKVDQDKPQSQQQQARQAPQKDTMTESSTQTQQASTPQNMSPDQAKDLMEILQERAKASESERREARRARMRDADVDKYW